MALEWKPHRQRFVDIRLELHRLIRRSLEGEDVSDEALDLCRRASDIAMDMVVVTDRWAHRWKQYAKKSNAARLVALRKIRDAAALVNEMRGGPDPINPPH
jgi:hypothetical protein